MDRTSPATGTGSDPLWKTWDKKADKLGARHTVYWVRRNEKHHESKRLGLDSAETPFVAGERYSGDWRDNKKDGYGVQTWVDGTKYEGEWRVGKMHGKGTFWVRRKGKLRKQYTGDWYSNARHGIGLYFYDDGSKYEGEWFRNMRHGRGKMLYKSGDVYEGEWELDKRSGAGVLFLANGDRFEGHWRDDKRDGTGRHFYLSTNKVYEGEWVDDVPKCGVFSDIPPELSDYPQAGAGPGGEGAPEDYFPMPELGLDDSRAVFREAVAAARLARATRARTPAVISDVFTPEQLRQLRHAFSTADKASRGCIMGSDLRMVLEQLGVAPSEEDVELLLLDLGVGLDGAISFDMFAQQMARLRA